VGDASDATKPMSVVNVDNVHVDHNPERPAGNTVDAGLRRLRNPCLRDLVPARPRPGQWPSFAQSRRRSAAAPWAASLVASPRPCTQRQNTTALFQSWALHRGTLCSYIPMLQYLLGFSVASWLVSANATHEEAKSIACCNRFRFAKLRAGDRRLASASCQDALRECQAP